ncbi:MAG TPA: hypothetical protein VHE54_18690 [Puia sp.]|nr:hypothetical protein [Puia sp.]
MPFVCFFLLLACFLMGGYGVLCLFGLRLQSVYTVTLSLLLGVALASFLPFLLQLCFVPITGVSVFGSLALVSLLLNIPTANRIRKQGAARSMRGSGPGAWRIRMYEIPYLLILGFLIFVSVWRCYYYPVTSRDALSGPEAIAEFAVREHTLINSFFDIDLWSTNNPFKSPFLISLQVVYKLAGFPFGQVWLSIVFISLTVFLYRALCEKLHPLLAGTLLLLFTIAPEPYAYTFMILYDYSNMVYFFLGLFFLFRWFSAGASPDGAARGQAQDPSQIQRTLTPTVATAGAAAGQAADPSPVQPARSFYFAGLLLGIATYIRSETLILVFLFLPPILLRQWRSRSPLAKILARDLLFILPSLLGYLLPVQLYVNHYLPVHYDVGGLIDPNAALPGLFRRYADIFTRLLTGRLSIELWGYFFYLTAILLAAESILIRRFNSEARNWLYAILALYVGLGLIGWLFPVMDLTDSTKRALFKMLPLALLYLANNQFLLQLSAAIARWEQKGPLRRLVPLSSRSTATASRKVLTKTGKTTIAQTRSRSRGASVSARPPGSRRKKK